MIILLIFLLIFIIINNQLVANNIILGSSFFYYKIFPSLFIILIITSIIPKTKLVYQIGFIIHPITKFLFKSPNYYYSGVILMCFIISTPASTKLIYSLHEDNKLSKCNSNNLLMFTHIVNPSYILYIAPFFALEAIIISIITNILIGVIIRFKTESEPSIIPKKTKNIILSSIKEATFTCLNLFGIILTTFVAVKLIQYYFNINPFFYGILDMSIGTSETNNSIYFIIYILFGGLSIHFQIFSIIKEKLSYLNFFIGRILSILIFIILKVLENAL